jgi:hypothetical protein
VLPVAQVGAAQASMASTVAAARGRDVAELSRPIPWVGASSRPVIDQNCIAISLTAL